ncbi:type IV pilus assembly PilZ [Desulfobulbus propionicus DSM 2032]|jgi:PilZ domain.|uniref:Type IV pilus assembly PilZ n=2 Tax=Desulfobulbus propionicus TaxID=894 RepID=A0A7U3YJI3_DESPD|nr:type IV pilus assembly PilZ [Desulfobulbus propionicus DSM 2032]
MYQFYMPPRTHPSKVSREQAGSLSLKPRTTIDMTTERRQYIRPESLNLLDYLVVDEQGRQGAYSMARTLNVSKGGILMETHLPLQQGQQVLITLGLKDRLIDVMGRVVYTTGSAGRYHNGIEFFHLSENDRGILENYVEAFHKLYAEESSRHPLP